jgi:hypothetical protein
MELNQTSVAVSMLVSKSTNRTLRASTISSTLTVLQSLPEKARFEFVGLGGLFSKSWMAC